MKNQIIILMLIVPLFVTLTHYFIEPYDPNAKIIKVIEQFIDAHNNNPMPLRSYI
jgi:hypothetical protein